MYLATVYPSNLSNLCMYECMYLHMYVYVSALVFWCSYTHRYAHVRMPVTPESSSMHLQKIREVFLHNYNTVTTSKKMSNNSLI